MPWSIDGRTAEHIVTTCDEKFKGKPSPKRLGVQNVRCAGALKGQKQVMSRPMVPSRLLDPGPCSVRSPWDLAHLAKPKQGRRASTWIVPKAGPVFCGIFTTSI